MGRHFIPDKITIHCTATKNGQPLSIETVDKWHKARGFKMVGYHMMIDVQGNLYRGRSLNQRGAHVASANTNNIGIALVGTDKFSKAQFRTLATQLEGLFMTYDIEYFNLFSHHEFKTAIKQGKTCPNMRIANLMAWYFMCDDHAIKSYLFV